MSMVDKDGRVDFHALSMEVTKREGGKKSCDIAQVKEVLGHALDVLGELWATQAAAVAKTLGDHTPKQREKQKKPAVKVESSVKAEIATDAKTA